MSSFIDSRRSSSNSSSFIYSTTLPIPTSPSEHHDRLKEERKGQKPGQRRTPKINRELVYQEPYVYEKTSCSVYQTNNTLNKKEKLKKAKNEYEELIEAYYQQLTIGCQQNDCRNKFCASGKGGIMSLQHQPALIMAIQLASMPTARLCKQHNHKIKHRYTQPTSPSSNRPFLHSLYSSTLFSSILQHHEQPSPPTLKNRQWTTDYWNLFGYNQDTTKDQEEEIQDESYYQLDNDSTPLSITPICIDLSSALDFLQHHTDDNIETWCRSVFQNWEGVGESFLNKTNIQLDDAKQVYQTIIHNNQQDFMTNSLEMLLDRMLSNVHDITELRDTNETIVFQWCRSILAVIEWILCCDEQEGIVITNSDDLDHRPKKTDSHAQTIITQKTIQVLSKIAHKKRSKMRSVLKAMFASLDAYRLERIVKDLKQYLSDHFHTGPYKLGFKDPVVMTLKCLELIYESSSILSPDVFYSPDICERLNIRTEYRVWTRVLAHGEGHHDQPTNNQRTSRLFSQHEFQFSWFSYPFLLPPQLKRKIMLVDTMSQMSLEYEDACVNHTLVIHAQKLLSEAPRMLNLQNATCPYLLLEIRRDHFYTDTMTQLFKKWGDLKKPLKVKFSGEDGVDQGGVQKEFFGVLFETLVSLGLFAQDDQTRLCWVQGVQDVRMYEVVGVLMGLCVYNGVIMNLQFPNVLWKVLVASSDAKVDRMAEQKQLFTLEDLEDGWPVLASGLRQLLEYDGDDVEDVFCRDYEISMDVFGQGVVTVPLMKEPVVSVTNENREAYVHDYCTHFMYTAQREQMLAIRRGMWSVIGSRAMSLCTADELEMVACGLSQGAELDMTELEKIAEYDDGYTADHPTIRQFWAIVHQDLTNEQKKQLLLFVTASDRVPVGGLKELTFYIQRNGPDSDRLPTALTCFSRLLLPEYATRQKLRDRLITAIENTKGFGLV